MPRRSGFAHLAALLVALLLSAIAASFVVETRVSGIAVRTDVAVAQARMAADAGVRHAIFTLSDRMARAYAEPAEAIPLWRRSDGTWTFHDATVHITVQAEAAKIDLNTAPADILQHLLLGAGLGQTEAGAVVDNIVRYRQRDGAALAADGPAVAAGGIVLAMTDELDSKAFDTVQEVLQVSGVTPDLFARLDGLITVHGTPWAQPDAAAGGAQGPRDAQAATTADGAVTYTLRAQARLDAGAVFVRQALVSFYPGRRVRHRVHSWHQGAVPPSGDARGS